MFPPAWRFPVVCELATGKLHYDNYQGRWGAEKELDRFKQRYAVEKATIEARRLGRSVLEQSLSDGTVKLVENDDIIRMSCAPFSNRENFPVVDVEKCALTTASGNRFINESQGFGQIPPEGFEPSTFGFGGDSEKMQKCNTR